MDHEDQADELVPAAPVPMLAGTFALYGTPDGGFVLVTDIPGRGVEQRAVPGRMVRLATSGPGGRMLTRLFGGDRNDAMD